MYEFDSLLGRPSVVESWVALIVLFALLKGNFRVDADTVCHLHDLCEGAYTLGKESIAREGLWDNFSPTVEKVLPAEVIVSPS